MNLKQRLFFQPSNKVAVAACTSAPSSFLPSPAALEMQVLPEFPEGYAEGRVQGLDIQILRHHSCF